MWQLIYRERESELYETQQEILKQHSDCISFLGDVSSYEVAKRCGKR